MIVTLAGSNSFALRRRLDELTAEFVKNHGELALERFDAEETEPPTVMDAILALPFLAKAKMVVVRSASKSSELAELIEQNMSSIPQTTNLVLYEPLTDKRTTFYKFLKTRTQFEQYNELDARELTKWLVEEAKKQKAEIDLPNANYLVQRLGPNQELLFNELQKLAIYNPKISRHSIDLLTEETPQSKVFDLLDAAFAGRKQKALALYEDQRAQKVEPQAILAMIAWQLNVLTLVKLAGNRSTSAIAKEAGISSYPVDKAMGLAQRISDERLEQMVEDALEIDYKNKTTTYDLDEALKTYIATL